MLKEYLKEIHEVERQGDAREESFYPALGKLIEFYAKELGKAHIHVTQNPKKTEGGNPDFRVWDGRHAITGYIEAKKPDSDLRQVEKSEQLKRYRDTFPNLILTNFYDFRLYRDGDLVQEVSIGRPFVSKKLDLPAPPEKRELFKETLDRFFGFTLPKTYTAQTLAVELAKRTRHLHTILEEQLDSDEAGTTELTGFYKAFSDYLLSGLSKAQFADLYAQTITYGLFASRLRAKEGPFTRRTAVHTIPKTIGILRDIFRFIAGDEPPEDLAWMVDDIAEVLAVADTGKIMSDYHRGGKGKDPVIHFYETFLSVYDPALREKRGVYYTPEPVVSYIVRSVHHILKETFGKPMGLADPSVTVLDPAAGILTFIAEGFRVAMAEFIAAYGEGAKEGFIRDHLLKNFYAFELMMAPYAIGHLKMGFILEELGYHLKDDERFKLYLTNTLEWEELEQTALPGMKSLSQESHASAKIKKEHPILVIHGNPPYSGHSANKIKWMDDLLKEGYTRADGSKDEGYYRVDGKPLGEKNPKWLQDDYVKFIRFAQWKLDQTGQGILAFITNHSYLDNPTFRGMRRSLVNSFDQIYLLDLHGNSLKKEKCPDGSKDENVFDIMQGVSIALFIKKPGLEKTIRRAELFGLRESKYEWLEKHERANTKWTDLKPTPEAYFFIEQDVRKKKKYDAFVKITDIFPVNSVGIVTSRDEFVIDFQERDLRKRMEMFKGDALDDDLFKKSFGLSDNTGWSVAKAREAARKDLNWKSRFVEILYRPFDIRHIFYADYMIERSRHEVMQHMLSDDNIAMVFMRQVALNDDYSHFLITGNIVDNRAFYSNKGIMNLAPLYLNPGSMQKGFDTEPKPNINEQFYQSLGTAYGKHPTPEDVLAYIYAICYAPTYRERYSEFLRTDFPRIPFTKDFKLFKKLAGLGQELMDLHLLKSPKLNPPIAKFPKSGSNRVGKTRKEARNYNAKEERLTINAEGQYFDGIPEEVWTYQIGGYQVLDKWLDSHKERVLSLDDIQHFCLTATALQHTIQIQEKIDELYPEAEKNILPVAVLK
jgi:type I restriction-modification system DNA methylase subunit